MLSEEAAAEQLRLLQAHRRTLAHYLEQLALHGKEYAPPVVANGIQEARAEISRIKEVLRESGITVEDGPNDTLLPDLSTKLDREANRLISPATISDSIPILTKDYTPTTEIEIVIQDTGRILRFDVPLNVKCRDIAKKLAEILNMSTLVPAGRKVEYIIAKHDTRKALDSSKSLQDQGYVPGTRLYIRPRLIRTGDSNHRGGKKCFPSYTTIIIDDGLVKPIYQICPGDSIKCVDFHSNVIHEGEVIEVVRGSASKLFSINNRVIGSAAQTILTGKGLITFEQLSVGDHIFEYPRLSPVPVITKDEIRKRTTVFNLIVSPFPSFFVEGILVEDQVGIPEDDCVLGTNNTNEKFIRSR